ncbi:MAG: histidine phosphatase family protein [Clostridia bacterium]|nr:histidine phosphatase family protein [Clostridia bacterium]
MRVLIIRHGDPNYANDCLTEKGKREAKLLADMLEKDKIDSFYSSPLGRAKETCDFVSARFNKQAEIFPWLQEFGYPVDLPTGEKGHLIWDLLPTFREEYPMLQSADGWLNVPFIKNSDVPEKYAELKAGLDGLFEKHGYKREGSHYKVERANRDTIALFCHFGVECVLLSHILGISPVALTHGFVALPTTVTTLYTEERREGVAIFRCAAFGERTHLTMGGEEPSFSARFREVYDSDERRD